MHALLSFLLVAFADPVIEEQRYIIGIASAAPPEIHAAALLRLAESPGLTGAKRRELIEQAFVAASQAHEAFPRVRAYGAPPDTSDSYRAAASGLRLDRLSLQTRAVRKVAADPQFAADLFARIEPPRPGRIGCESGTVPDLQDYYDTAASLNADPTILLAGAESHIELAALAKTVNSELVAEAFAARLQVVVPDSRAFAASWTSLQADLTRIHRQFPSPTLIEGIRKYILVNFNGTRCADAGHIFQTGRAVVDWFNAEIRTAAPPLEDRSFPSPKIEGRAKVEAYWESDANQALMQGLRDLRFSSKGLPFTDAERGTSEWKQSLNQFLSKLRAARPGFHQTTALLQALIEFTPRGTERDQLFAMFLDVMQTSDLQRQSPAEWLWRADGLYRMLQQSADSDLEKLTAGFRNGGVPSLVLYVWFNQNMAASGMF